MGYGLHQPTLMYRLFDDSGALLYVGSTSDYLSRRDRHIAREWWVEVAYVVIEEYSRPSGWVAWLEQYTIWHEAPKYNVRHQRLPHGATPEYPDALPPLALLYGVPERQPKRRKPRAVAA
jgi:hypothetical protein